MLSDSTFFECLQYKCFLCGRTFFSSRTFFGHIQAHNFRQYATHMCYHRLHLRCTSPCQFCSLPEHLAQFSNLCLPLFHLAVFLCNGSPEAAGSGPAYLGQAPDGFTDCTASFHNPGFQKARSKRRRQKEQKAQGEQERSEGQSIRRYFGSHPKGGDACPEDGNQPTGHAAGAPIHPSHSSRTWLNPSDDAHGHEGMACRGPTAAIEACVSISDDSDHNGESGGPDKDSCRGSGMEGGTEPVADGRTGQSALSPLEPNQQKVGTIERGQHFAPGDSPSLSELAQASARPDDYIEISRPHQDRQHGSCDPLVVAPEQQEPTGGVGRITSSLLARVLATYPDPNSTSRSRKIGAIQGDHAGLEMRSVRLLLNPSNCCYANASLLGLTWVTMLMGMLDPAQWPFGYDLILAMVTDSWLPLCLTFFEPFLSLLDSDWNRGKLDIQQDAA